MTDFVFSPYLCTCCLPQVNGLEAKLGNITPGTSAGDSDRITALEKKAAAVPEQVGTCEFGSVHNHFF